MKQGLKILFPEVGIDSSYFTSAFYASFLCTQSRAEEPGLSTQDKRKIFISPPSRKKENPEPGEGSRKAEKSIVISNERIVPPSKRAISGQEMTEKQQKNPA